MLDRVLDAINNDVAGAPRSIEPLPDPEPPPGLGEVLPRASQRRVTVEVGEVSDRRELYDQVAGFLVAEMEANHSSLAGLCLYPPAYVLEDREPPTHILMFWLRSADGDETAADAEGERLAEQLESYLKRRPQRLIGRAKQVLCLYRRAMVHRPQSVHPR